MSPLPAARLEGIDLVCVDVFDTLVLRRPLCERRRLLNVARAAVEHPLLRPHLRRPETLWELRLQARRLAYRIASIEGDKKEVRLADLLERVARLLSLPPGAATLLAELELEEEIRCVVPNRPFLSWLAEVRCHGKRVVALSDTPYSSAALTVLLDRHGITPLLDAVYTSADLGSTKHSGEAFDCLIAHEEPAPHLMLHIGDDPTADARSPISRGLRSLLMPRSRLARMRHRADGASFELAQRLAVPAPRHGRPAPPASDLTPTERFGADVLGPIVGEYCLRQWLYMASVQDAAAVALFCARGGLRMELAARTLSERLGLPSPLPTGKLMISRLVAARAALMRDSPRAFEEIGREFKGDSCATVARALAAAPLELGPAWDAPFSAATFRHLLAQGPQRAELMRHLSEQTALFERHLEAVAGPARRVLLCDTGLFASTQRLLEHGLPHWRWESVMFARSNYKGFEASHFARTTGLEVERDAYSPLDARSSVLRYWHLVEDLFEPTLQSVKRFSEEPGGAVRANLEVEGWHEALEGLPDSVFCGVMHYLRSLQPGTAATVLDDAAAAWQVLASAIVFPSRSEAEMLAVGRRSIDFGRASQVAAITNLAKLRQSLWREGVIAQRLSALRWPALALLQTSHMVRRALRASRDLISTRPPRSVS